MNKKRGIRVIRVGRAYQMTSRPEYYPYIGQLYKSEAASIHLTDTQLEILAIIAYRQPITKMEIEEIRGVRSDAVVNRLMEYGLIEEKGRLKAPGRARAVWHYGRVFEVLWYRRFEADAASCRSHGG